MAPRLNHSITISSTYNGSKRKEPSHNASKESLLFKGKIQITTSKQNKEHS
jgi:hypothetical protein